VYTQKTSAPFIQWQGTPGVSATPMRAKTRTQKKNGATNKVQKKKEKGQVANVSNIALAMEHVINNDNSLISDSEMMAEVCCFEQPHGHDQSIRQ
jgi:hypothetical protein